MKDLQQLGVHKKSAFTLVEILIAMAVFSVLLTAVLQGYIQSSKMVLKNDAKLNVNDSTREMNSKIIAEAREADAFIMYESFYGTTIDGHFVDFRNSAYAGKGRIRDGGTGKFMLLLYFGEDDNYSDRTPPPLEKMVGMYLDADVDEDTGPLKYFSTTSISDPTKIEVNIPSASQSSQHITLLEEIKGLLKGDVFYNFSGKSIMINAKIAEMDGIMKESSTYNFTITPR